MTRGSAPALADQAKAAGEKNADKKQVEADKAQVKADKADTKADKADAKADTVLDLAARMNAFAAPITVSAMAQSAADAGTAETAIAASPASPASAARIDLQWGSMRLTQV